MQVLESVLMFLIGVLFFVGFLFILYLVAPLWDGIVVGALLLTPWAYWSFSIGNKLSEKLIQEKAEEETKGKYTSTDSEDF